MFRWISVILGVFGDRQGVTRSLRSCAAGGAPATHMPAGVSAPKHHAILVPYRDRKVHLRKFLAHMKAHFAGLRGHVMHIYVMEQDDKRLFNRAWLFNAGLRTLLQEAVTFTCVITHDVDFLPLPAVDYTKCALPTQLGSELEHFGWGVPYGSYCGGVVSASMADWRKINGFSNRFKGWGGEDDELGQRFGLAGLMQGGQIHRPPKGEGCFSPMHDEHHTARTSRKSPHKTGQMIDNTASHWKTDGLSSVKYTATSRRALGCGVWHLQVQQR